MMKNGDYSLKRIGGNSLGFVESCWFLRLWGKNPFGKVAVSKP
ncbi:hypothetical protein ACF3NW_02460 [Eikenella halliae]